MSVSISIYSPRFQHYGKRCFALPFTLIEVMVVLAIIMLLVGISFNFIGHLPVGLQLRSTAASVEKLLASARNRALFQGKRIDVLFNPDSNVLSLGAFVSNESEGGGSKGVNALGLVKRSKDDRCVIPSNVTVEFPDLEDDAPAFRFFPDGSVAGGEMRISIKESVIVITVSQLTGIVSINDEEED